MQPQNIDLTNLEQELAALIANGKQGLTKISKMAEFDKLKSDYLGKDGFITQKMGMIRDVANDQKKQFGQIVNNAKNELQSEFDRFKEQLEEQEINARLAGEKIDLTMPGQARARGKIHPIWQAIDEITAIFSAMGFDIKDGPEIEDQYHNFCALNIAQNHPARQMHDTFYLEQKDSAGEALLLRTHTSNTQIRMMKSGKAPFKFISYGRTYRCDSDMTHTPMFHQIEGVYIDKDVNMGHLKYCLQEFCRLFFEVDDLPIRLRPSHFPFTEPSAEVDIGCERKSGQLKIGAGSDWLEILGCGMVHPNVMRECGLDPDEYQGFAFGMGLERLAMLKYGAPDLREFYAGNKYWLNHYGFDYYDVPNMAGGLTK